MSKLTATKFYNVWRDMVKRCTNRNHRDYKNYGGRGITICNSWLRYEEFENDMYESYVYFGYDNGYTNESKATLDRIDNSKGYSKENCRWATMKQQSNNRRIWNEKPIEYKGEIKNISGWAKHFGIKVGTLRNRVFIYGWEFEKAVTIKPVPTRIYKSSV